MSRRIGILGGTFDPIHVGHLAAAEAARVALGLTQILVIPTRRPPHRPMQPVASTYHRFAMTALGIAGRPDYHISEIEVSSGGPSYTTHTLGHLHQAGYPASCLFFILGADAFGQIASWHDYPAILRGCHYAVVTRPGHSQQALKDRLPALTSWMHDVRESASSVPGPPSIFLLDAVTPDVSSSRIRRLLSEGGSVSGMLPPAVEEYVRKQALYSLPESDERSATGPQHHQHDHE